MARDFISRIVDLRSGERAGFLGAFWLLSLTIAGHTLLETARDAMFLSHLRPEYLTFVYGFIAIGVLVIAPASVRLVQATGPRNALITTLLLSAFVASWFRLRQPTPGLVFALYVFGALSATTLVAEFWILASTLFTGAQGRRLFGPLAAGGVVGAIVGAGAASLLLTWLDVRSLLVAAPLAYFGAALVATGIEIEDPADSAGPPGPVPSRGLFKVLQEEPFVLRLAVIAVFSSALSVVVDYLFKARVGTELQPSELGPFFARYQLILNLASLALQLAVTGRLVERVGVAGLVLLTPAVLFLGGLSVLLSAAAIASVVALKGLDSALRNSAGRVSLELLWGPVEARERARTLVDGVVTRGAQAIAALLLLVITFQTSVSLGALSAVVVALSLAWLLASRGVRSSYVELLRKALRRGGLERPLELPEIDVTAAETLIEALARPEPGQVIASMNVLSERGRARLVPALILYHDDEAVVLRALELFGGSDRTDWHALGQRLLGHASRNVRLAAVRALALSGARDVLLTATKADDALVAALASLHLAQREGRSITEDQRLSALMAAGENGRALRLALVEAIAAHPTPESVTTLLELAQDPALGHVVTLALVQVPDERAIPFLVSRLALRDDRVAARAALVRLGTPAFEAVVRALGDSATDARIVLHAPRTVAAFATPKAVAALLGVLQSARPGLVRYKALRGLEQIARGSSLPIPFAPIAEELFKNGLEYLRLFALAEPLRKDMAAKERSPASLVLELVEDKLQQSLDRILRLVQIAHRTDEIEGVFAALGSTNRHERARALEFLDALMRSWPSGAEESSRVLRLVVDDLSVEERMALAAPWVGRFETSSDSLARLSEGDDPILSEIALHALARERLGRASARISSRPEAEERGSN